MLRGDVIPIPSHIVNKTTAGIFVGHTLVATTGGKLPLGFGGQTEILAGQFVQLFDKQLAILPRNHLHRALRVIIEVAGVTTHDSLPQFLGYLGLTDAETRQRHIMDWSLPTHGIHALLNGRSHHERARLNGQHCERHSVCREDTVFRGIRVYRPFSIQEIVNQGYYIADVHLTV